MFYRLEQVKDCVGFLYSARMQQDEPEPEGTCFFMEIEESGSTFRYLVTAKHVWEILKDKDQGFLRVTNPDGGLAIIPIETSEDQWLFHEDDSVDLAVQVWTRERWEGKASDLTYWPIEGLRADGGMGNLLREGEDAVFVGLMRDFPGVEKNLIMLRDGMIGLVPDEPIHGHYEESDYYVLNAQSYKGNSGAPVYLVSGGTFRLMGVLTYGFYEEAGRYLVRGVPHTGYNLGVSLVTPNEKVEDILNTDEEKSRRASLKQDAQGEPLSGGQSAELTKEAMEAALRRVSRPDGKAVIEKRDEASSET